MDAVERAAILILANQYLDVAARAWGPDMRDDPAHAPRGAVDSAILALGQKYQELVDATGWTGPNVHCRREMAAIDMAILSVGHQRTREAFDVVGGMWRVLWSARKSVGQALVVIRDWEQGAAVDAFPPLPDGSRQTDEQVLGSALRFPRFLRNRKG